MEDISLLKEDPYFFLQAVKGIENLCWDRGELRLRDPRTGQFLPTPKELQAVNEAAAERADTERVASEAAEVQVAELESKLMIPN